MKKQKFTETQILQAIKQYEGGREALDVSREYGISKELPYSTGVISTVVWNPPRSNR